MTCVIPFCELFPNASVRFTNINGTYFICIRDLIMMYCEKDSHYAHKIWRTRLSDECKEEVTPHCSQWKFNGFNEKVQDVVSFQGALKLLAWLPGNSAKDFRNKTNCILIRYMAGDCSLLKEIERNAASNEPINVMARNAMESLDSSDDEQTKKRRLKRRDALEELEIQERTIAIQERSDGRKKEALSYVKSSMELLQYITGKPLDERTNLQCEDLVRNMLFTGKSITNGEQAASDGLTISVVAAELGFPLLETKPHLAGMGRIMAIQYREKYDNKDPDTHKQFVNGACVNVCSYMERDRDMLEQVIKNYMASPPQPKGKAAATKKYKKNDPTASH